MTLCQKTGVALRIVLGLCNCEQHKLCTAVTVTFTRFNKVFEAKEKEACMRRFRAHTRQRNGMAMNIGFNPNSQQVWYEISNTLLSAKFSLAESGAYKDVELFYD